MFSPSSAALVGFPASFLSLLFALLAAAPAPAAARFASITFSQVKQCGQFTVDFVGGKAPAALPLTLSILPLNGTPIFLPLPDNAWNATTQIGDAIAFVPFPAGTEFIASLDDANGQGTALVSDVLVVEPSDSNDTSCLPTDPATFVAQYAVEGTLQQCEPFSVRFNSSQRTSPTVRAFNPKGASFPVNQSAAFDDASGVANYTMDAERDSQVILLFKDASGYAETSQPLPVFGDIQSSTACIPTNPLANAATLESTASSSRVTPKIAVIVIAVCGGVVAIVAMAMVAWCVIHRRKARAQRFTKLAEAQSPTGPAGPDPEKQMMQAQDPRRISPPPRIATDVNLSPISPVDAPYDDITRYLRNPPYTGMTVGSSLHSPSSPDPFGEQQMGSLLGSLSARESLTARMGLGATALGNTGSTLLAVPPARESSTFAYERTPARSSAFDPMSEHMPGTSPYSYFARAAITPDNSLASQSVLRRPASTQTASTVSSQEIDHILEMATIYGAAELPDMPRAAVTAPATIRSSAYMAGRESRVASPAHGRSPSASTGVLSPTLTHQTSQSTLRHGAGRFREPPLATLPMSPLPSPGARPSFDVDGVAVRDSGLSGLQAPRAPMPAALLRNVSSATRASVYSVDDGLDDFTMLQPPPPRRMNSR